MKKTICILLGCVMLNFAMVSPGFSSQRMLLAASVQKDVTANPPQMHVEDEVELPSDSAEAEKGFFSKYKWWLLAGLVIVGGAAAAGGGGGGGGGSSSDGGTTTPTTGNIQVDW